MTVLNFPSDPLSQKSVRVTDVTDDVLTLIDKMWDVVKAENGVGLAANQIGSSLSVAVIRNIHDDDCFVIINPEIVDASESKVSMPEGCLSLKGIRGNVMRHTSVTVKYVNEKGEECIKSYTGRTAHILQHEIDHLNGIVFIDHYDEKRRNVMLKKLQRNQQRAN